MTSSKRLRAADQNLHILIAGLDLKLLSFGDASHCKVALYPQRVTLIEMDVMMHDALRTRRLALFVFPDLSWKSIS